MTSAVKNPGMVWIHGGGWKSGNGQLDRSGFLNNGIVAMTVQVGLKVSSNETPTSFLKSIVKGLSEIYEIRLNKNVTID